MLRSFRIRNFRCLEDLEIPNLARVNLFVGDNDAGKTALLEGLFAHLSQANPINLLTLKAFRGSSLVLGETLWQEFFTGFDDSREIISSSVDSDGNERTNKITAAPTIQVTIALQALQTSTGEVAARIAGKQISYRPLRAEYKGPGMESPVENELMLDPNTVFAQKQNIPADLQGYFFSTAGPPGAQTVANHLSELLVRRQDGDVLALAKAIDERINELSVASPKGSAEVFVSLGEGPLVPLTLMGSGVLRAVGIGSSIPVHARGVILIDEVDSGIYYKRLADMWGILQETAKTCDVQIFASTHSAECVSAAVQAVPPDLQDADPLHVYRLVRGKRVPIPYDRDTLKPVAEFMAELR